MRIREEAAARCTKVIRGRVPKKQATKARAEHLGKCCLAPGKRNVRGKPMSELYVNGNFKEDREEWQIELQRHCAEEYTDQEATREVQENRIEYFKKMGDQQFTVNGRRAEITVDLVLQARAKMSDNKVIGLEDTVVSEMIKQLPYEEICIITKCFQERFMGQMEAPNSWTIVRLVFLREPDAEPKKGITSYGTIALTPLVLKWYATFTILRLKK